MEEAQIYAKKNGFQFFECSARANKNIIEIFMALGTQITANQVSRTSELKQMKMTRQRGAQQESNTKSI